MDEMMRFPNTVEEFMEQYKIVDTEQVYTNGAELVPIFRMKQWFDHIEGTPSSERRGRWKKCGKSAFFPDDDIFTCSECFHNYFKQTNYCPSCGAQMEVE